MEQIFEKMYYVYYASKLKMPVFIKQAGGILLDLAISPGEQIRHNEDIQTF